MQFHMTALLFAVFMAVSFAGGYIYHSRLEMDNIIHEQNQLLQNQLVLKEGRLYRLNRVKGTVTPCKWIGGQGLADLTEFRCGKDIRVLEK